MATYTQYGLDLTGQSGKMLKVNNTEDGFIFNNISIEPIEKLYSELKAMYDGSTLTPGQLYKITDFATVHNILDGNTTSGDINTGTTEPLILLATSTNAFDKQAYSTLFPKDIIYYDITGGDTRDIAFFDDTVPIAGLKGIIYYRKDTVQNVETWYDFRNVKFLRNNVLVYTFGDYYNWVNDVHLGRIYLDYTIDNYDYSSKLNNIVFNTTDNLYTCFSNVFGDNCFNNTVGGVFYSNKVGNEFCNNTVGNYFGSNKVGNRFCNNTVGNYFNHNTIEDDFNTNTIGNNFKYNDLKYSLSSVNFTTATHVYADYNCEIFKKSTGVLRLKYVDGNDADVIVNITA